MRGVERGSRPRFRALAAAALLVVVACSSDDEKPPPSPPVAVFNPCQTNRGFCTKGDRQTSQCPTPWINSGVALGCQPVDGEPQTCCLPVPRDAGPSPQDAASTPDTSTPEASTPDGSTD